MKVLPCLNCDIFDTHYGICSLKVCDANTQNICLLLLKTTLQLVYFFSFSSKYHRHRIKCSICTSIRCKPRPSSKYSIYNSILNQCLLSRLTSLFSSRLNSSRACLPALLSIPCPVRVNLYLLLVQALSSPLPLNSFSSLLSKQISSLYVMKVSLRVQLLENITCAKSQRGAQIRTFYWP